MEYERNPYQRILKHPTTAVRIRESQHGKFEVSVLEGTRVCDSFVLDFYGLTDLQNDQYKLKGVKVVLERMP
jgi:hypothetical protein